MTKFKAFIAVLDLEREFGVRLTLAQRDAVQWAILMGTARRTYWGVFFQFEDCRAAGCSAIRKGQIRNSAGQWVAPLLKGKKSLPPATAPAGVNKF